MSRVRSQLLQWNADRYCPIYNVVTRKLCGSRFNALHPVSTYHMFYKETWPITPPWTGSWPVCFRRGCHFIVIGRGRLTQIWLWHTDPVVVAITRDTVGTPAGGTSRYNPFAQLTPTFPRKHPARVHSVQKWGDVDEDLSTDSPPEGFSCQRGSHTASSLLPLQE